MQEEINHKTITVYIRGAKVTAQTLKAALRAMLRARENDIASYTTPAVPAWAALAARWVDTPHNDANWRAGRSIASCTSLLFTAK